ncbi:MAG: serine protease [Chloroflexota bacterium]
MAQGIDRTLIKNVLPAVVQVVALKRGLLGNYSPAWTGSGTIVDPRGIILTNCHVANPSAMGMPSPKADKLGIAITERSDEPPALTYLADITVQAPHMDLAVLKIVRRMDGKSISRLKLPSIPLGDSDRLELGDMMSIFGYPGIGGDTVTFTFGSVSGFTRQKDVTDGRAWIKTDATISGGNSGGTAVNQTGFLVGIPTQAAAGTGVSPVDARPVVDTNRDGRVDQRDTPMAIGGFINGLRPVNLAKPLLAKAGVNISGGTPSRLPAQAPAPQPTQRPSSSSSGGSSSGSSSSGSRRRSGGGLKRFDETPEQPQQDISGDSRVPTVMDMVFCEQVTRDGMPINPSAILRSGVNQVFASFEFDWMRNRTNWSQHWTYNGQSLHEAADKWEDGPRGRKTLAISSRDALPDGEYQLTIKVRDSVVGQGAVTVGSLQEDKDTEVSGQVIDRATNKGLAEALVIALKPGIKTADFIRDQKREYAYTSVKTDRRGRYTLPKQLLKGQSYGLVVIARGYRDMAIDGALRINETAPERSQIFPVPMMRS